jgi:hypothetical protein
MSDQITELQNKIIKLQLENKVMHESINRGMTTAAGMRLLSKKLEENFTLVDGYIQPLSGASFENEFNRAIRSDELLRDLYSDEVTPKTNEAQKASESVSEGVNKPYGEWSIEDKAAYRQEHGDHAFTKLVSEHFKAQREANK